MRRAGNTRRRRRRRRAEEDAVRFADLRARRATTATENGALDDDADDRWSSLQ
ncbi:MAG: hypothetical protein AAFV01_18000 [Bacteroidota bacterium]